MGTNALSEGFAARIRGIRRSASDDVTAGVLPNPAFQHRSGTATVRTKRSYASCGSSACASTISGISGVGEKPLSAGARTACASGRSEEFGERKRRLQTETASTLLSGDVDRGPEGILGGAGI